MQLKHANIVSRFILLFLVLTVGMPVRALPLGDPLFFRHILPEDGLSNNVVYDIVEDDVGFIWIATRNGLNRFDGSGFRVYDQFDGGLKSSHINILYKDVNGNIWVGTQSGLARYNQATDHFHVYSNPLGNENTDASNIISITGNSRGDIWFGTNASGIMKLEQGDDSVKVIVPEPENLPGLLLTRVRGLMFENDSTLWFGAYEGLCRYHLNTGRCEVVLERWKDIQQRVQVLLDYNEEWLFGGTDGEGILKLNKHTGAFSLINSGNSSITIDLVRDLAFSEEGILLAGTDGGGMVLMDPVSFEMEIITNDPNDPYSIINNSIYSIFRDHYKNLWVGTYAGGISFNSEYDRIFLPVGHEVNNPNSLSDNNVRSILQDSRGGVWFGTRGGLNLLRNNAHDFRIFKNDPEGGSSISSNTILSLMDDHRGNLWVGTFAGGINLLDLDTYRIRKFTHPGDENNSLLRAHVYDMLLSRTFEIWIATMGGVYRYNLRNDQMERYLREDMNLLDNAVKVLMEDRKGRIWIGTNNGLNVLIPGEKSFRAYRTREGDTTSLSNNRILTLLEDEHGDIWIGTEGGGINILSPESGVFRHISASDGLPGNVINCILQDHNGQFWITTNRGLVRYQPLQNRFRIYSESDGLQSNQFYSNAGIITGDRRIILGGPGGFNAFFPDSLKENRFSPRVILTDLYLYNKPVIIGEEGSPLNKQLFLQDTLVLRHDQNNVSIHFTSIGLINSDNSKYATFLERFDRDWTDFTENQSAVYTNLDPGRYTFMVKAVNSSGVESEQAAAVYLRVMPPPWKSWVAFVIYAIVLTSLLLLFRAYIISWINVKNELEMQRREKEHMEELNQLKLRFFTNISHEFRTPLTLIRGYLDSLLDNENTNRREDAGQIIRQNINRLLRLINELLDFRKAESGLTRLSVEKLNIVEFIRNIKDNYTELSEQRGIDFTFHVASPIPDIWFDPAKIEKVMFNLLSNAFKFTDDGGQIRIILDMVQRKMVSEHVAEKKMSGENLLTVEYVVISVFNTGEGIPEEELGLIFDRFYQSGRKDETRSNRQKGSGIGLAYSKRLVELHGGIIGVTSNPETGTIFNVELPTGEQHFTAEEKTQENPQGYQLRIDSSEIKNELFLSAFDAPDKLREGLPLVLIVEDNPSIIRMIRDQEGDVYNFVAAPNGREGLTMADKYMPDLIITDLMMPVMNGIEFTEKIKSELATSHIPVIMLTAKTDDETQIAGLDHGADAFIKKPYNPEVLKLTIRNLLESRQLLKKKFSGFNTLVPEEVTSNRLDEKFLDKLINVIEARSGETELDVVSVSREMGMSRSVLYRKIKSISGYTIQEFVRVCKLKKAANLLINSQESISEIAYSSGFSNAKHFSTRFRKHFGVTPTEFRKNAGK
ncbi:MAG: two-component regulator propeller domain-containing protein [Bacteroidales bacterium]|nr:two-component regulator propeller domain-containing protein [Bacteroidales bacterium]MDT8431937.1 two-component regulator propeller domain-containing protein [Bacteroidales bacterium]